MGEENLLRGIENQCGRIFVAGVANEQANPCERLKRHPGPRRQKRQVNSLTHSGR